MIRSFLTQFFKEPLSAGLNLDSAEATFVHQDLIRRKPFLRQLYERYYVEFERANLLAPDLGVRLELGAGGGFLQEHIQGLIRVDLRPAAKVDVVASALALPFAKESVGAIFMLNVLHHLQKPRIFFEEVSRILLPGGRLVMIEPYVSPLSKIVYTHLHHEPFNPDQVTWELEEGGAMTTANDALPWIIFERDQKIFEELFGNLEILRVEPHTVLMYLASGGLSYRALLPGGAFGPLAFIEDRLRPLGRRLSSMMTVEIVKE